MKNLIAVPAFYWFRRLPIGFFSGNFEVGLTGWLIIGDVSIVDSSFGRRPSVRSFTGLLTTVAEVAYFAMMTADKHAKQI